MRLRILIIFLIQCVSGASANGAYVDPKLEKFRLLPGAEKVAIVFHERFHGRSLLFWKRSSEVWLTAADARLSFEQEILAASADPGIDGALADEIRGNDVERARYGVFLLCLRARFVPDSDLPIKQPNALVSSGSRDGGISPFPPDFGKLDPTARLALGEALASSNRALRNSARIYTFAMIEDLSSVGTVALVDRWSAASRKIPACDHDRPFAYSDAEQSLSLLRAAVASRGLEAAVALSSLLRNERDAEARADEIDLVRFIDSAVVRLRRSEQGRQAIQAVKDAVLSRPLQYCWIRYNRASKERQTTWAELDGQFFGDRVECGLGSWATMIALAMKQQYKDQTTVAATFEPKMRTCGPQMQTFLSRLTDLDPTFPSWEFPSTGTRYDMLHRDFRSKIRRYHEMWMKLNANQ